MNISSLAVLYNPQKPGVIDDINAIKGCEVSLSKDGKAVVVVESEDTDSEVNICKRVMDVDGVSGAYVAYHYFEDETIESEYKEVL